MSTILTFSSNDGNGIGADNLATDGEGGSSDIGGITIQIANISDVLGTQISSLNWYNDGNLSSGDGFSGITTDFAFGGEWKGMSIRSAGGEEFQLESFDFFDWGTFPYAASTLNITGFRDNVQVATDTFSSNNNNNRVNVDISGNTTFDAVDEVRITFDIGTGYLSLNNITIANAVPPNTAPSLGGTPADDTAVEDAAAAIDLSAYNISDAEGDDPLTLTLAVDRGTIASVDGNGTVDGVTIASSSTSNMTLQGSAAALNTYLDDTSHITFTTDSNDTSAATLTVTPNDGTANGTADTVTITITPVNDDPSVSGLPASVTVAEDTLSNIDLSAASIGDIDSSTITVTLSASGGSFGTPSDGAGTGGGVTETLVNATTISLVGSPADISTYLDTASNIRYTPPSNAVGAGQATISVTANDGDGSGDVALGTVQVNVTEVNDPPVLTGLDATPSVTEDGIPVVLDADVTISDEELDALNGGNGDYAGATLAIARNGGADTSDILSVITGGNLTVAGGPNGGGTISASGNVIATISNTGNGQLQITFADNGTTPTTALVNESLQAIRYTNGADDPATSVQLDWDFSDGNGHAAGSVTVSLTNVNDAPTLTATGGNPTFVEGGAAQDLYNTVSADAVEIGDRITGLTLTVTNLADSASEILSIDGSDVALTDGNSVTTATNSLSVSVNVSGTTATVSFTGATLSAAQAQTLVDGLTYRNLSDNPTTAGNRVVTITGITDDGGTANGGAASNAPTLSSTVSLTAVNDAPSVASVFGETSQIITGGGAQAITGLANATVSNADSIDYNGGFLTIAQISGAGNGSWGVDGTTVTAGGDGTILVGETLQVSGVTIGTIDATADGQSGHDLTINFNADSSSARIEAFLQNLRFEAPSSIGDRGYTLTLNDGDGIANGGDADASGSITLSITPNPPVLGNLDGDSVSATENAGAVSLDIGANATVTDADSPNFNGGTLRASVTNNADAASDVLSVATSGVVALAAMTAGSNVSVSGTVIGTLANNIVAGNDFVVTLNADATPARVQSIVQALSFEATGEAPTAGTRTVSVTLSDGSGSGNAHVNVAVTALNDAPQITGLVSDVSFTEDTPANLDLSALTLSDVDTTSSLTLTLTASAGTLAATSGGGVTVGGSATGTLILAGTIVDIDTFLNSATHVHYSPAANAAGNDAATISLTINDTGTSTDLGTVNVDITPVNDAPTNPATADIQQAFDTPHTFTVGDFGFADVDGDTLQSVRIDTLPGAGVLSLNASPVSATDVITIGDIIGGNIVFTAASGASGDDYAIFTYSVNDGTTFSAAPGTITIDVAAAPPAGGGGQPAEPEPDLVDGVPVERTTTTENSLSVEKIVITPVSNTREDTDAATSLADIPLHFDSDGQAVTTVSVPTGVGFTARANETATIQTSFRDGLYLLRDSAPESDWFSMINGLDQWLNGVSAGWLNQVTLTTNTTSAPSEPIRITGREGDSTEVMVIDGSQLPVGAVLDLDNIEFAIIVGDVTVRSGAGTNVVYAGSGAQNIVLGADDDHLNGGDGDDTIGSEGGDDRLFGDAGNDTLFGGPGANVMHGGLGMDTIIYAANRDRFEISIEKGQVIVTSLDGPSLQDTIINAELIRFTDTDLSIDASSSAFSESDLTIATLFTTVLGRQADLAGYQFWTNVADTKLDLASIAMFMLRSEENTQTEGQAFDTLSLEAQIDRLYQEILGRAPDDAGAAFWNAAAEAGFAIDDIAGAFVDAPEFVGLALQPTGLDFLI
ncbi:Hypothetical protein yeeJ (plasmid) [Ruegeria sp. TM1040]|uniref:DUF4214 domain-containing protein n=1 Tax=Ruegeria sp. (strain TM1040) TaxID=292414 RepID=UPI000046302E|nr:DUF4214 domain-containing protein [Ruegeria sp. TM1040]ABF61900.1 Hypothetical protein yeeJ [Ruegeria sp. TM1040]